jgi:translation initiation factor 2 subunit 1
MEGLILSTEVTTKRVRSVNKFLKIGKQETMMVVRVDRDKRYIDLSKPEEAA